uniref:Uncharacterized protein n=1 Tax=Anser cygnoides TaxID=8845 RepID=A0A8B9E1Q5_ANSCY
IKQKFSPGGQNPSVKLLRGLSAPWRALTLGSTSPHTGAHPAEASRGSWWSPTGKSRRRARSLRSSSLAQTGNGAVTLGAGRAACPTATSLGGFEISEKNAVQTPS